MSIHFICSVYLFILVFILDDEYITSGEDGVVIKNLAEDKSEVLLDHNKKVSKRHYFFTIKKKKHLCISPHITDPSSM